MCYMASYQRNAFDKKTMKESSCTDRGFFCILFTINTDTHSVTIQRSVLHKNSKEKGEEAISII